jgi:hypothetical protein
MTDPNLSTSDIASKPDATSDSGRDEDARRQARNEGQAVTAADEPLQREGESGDNRRERGDREPEREPLLSTDESGRFTDRWHEIQASFVDQPQRSVEEADRLVAELMQQLAASFANERNKLEELWDRGDDVSTEHLRLALTHYRSFFDRLLSA